MFRMNKNDIVINELTTPTGEKLVNVPMDAYILKELGFSEAEIEVIEVTETMKAELEQLKLMRAPLLIEADIMINKAFDSGQDTSALSLYRQQLRDITEDFKGMDSITWPTQP